MAENKKSFILYADQSHIFSALTDEEAGKLVKHLFAYVNDEDPEMEDRLIKIAFEPIKQQLKRDLKHWESIKTKRSEAGKASAEVRKQRQINPTSVENVEHMATLSTVNDNENVNENANAYVNHNVNDNAHESCINDIAFIELYAVQLKTTKDEIIRLIDFFNNHCKLTDKAHANISEYKRHFNHWVRYQDVKPLPKKQAWEDPIAYENEVRRKLGKPPVE